MFEKQPKRKSLQEGIEEYIHEGGVVNFRQDKEGEKKRKEALIQEALEKKRRLQRHEERAERKKKLRYKEFQTDLQRSWRFKRSSLVGREENAEYLRLFKNILAERLEGLGAVRETLVEAVTRDPNIPREELKQVALRVAAEHQLPLREILPKIEQVLNAYFSRREAIETFAPEADFPDRELLEKYHVGDFERAYREGKMVPVKKPFHVELNYQPGEVKGSWYCPGIHKGSIAIISDGLRHDGTLREDREGTRTHEEGHAIDNLSKEIQNSVSEDFRPEVQEALKKYKDEILAFFRAGNMKYLAYSFFPTRMSWKKHTFSSPQEKKHFLMENASYHEFLKDVPSQEIALVEDIVTRALEALEKVEKNMPAFSREKVIGIFQHQPLRKWPRVADALLREGNFRLGGKSAKKKP